MKKYFLVTAIGLSLMGCSDDKVTKEMLVGDWQCQINRYEKANSKSTDDYGTAKETREYRATFSMTGSTLYQVLDGKQRELPFENFQNNVSEDESSSKTTKTSRLVRKENNDHFVVTQETEVKKKDNQTDVLFKREKDEIECTRVK